KQRCFLRASDGERAVFCGNGPEAIEFGTAELCCRRRFSMAATADGITVNGHGPIAGADQKASFGISHCGHEPMQLWGEAGKTGRNSRKVYTIELSAAMDEPAKPRHRIADCGRGGSQLISTALERIPVGVVVERRRGKSAWAGFLWRPVSVFAGSPST